MNKYRISIGDSGAMGSVSASQVTWKALCKRLAKFEVADKKGGKFFVGGAFKGNKRVDTELEGRSLLTLDLDDYVGDVEALSISLDMIPCAYIAYSTFRHTATAPRVRIVVPLSREVSGDEYRQISESFCNDLPLAFDACSFKPNQFMYLPVRPKDGDEWVKVGEGDVYHVGESHIVSDELDFEDMLAQQPLDIDVDKLLTSFKAESCTYDDWLRVCSALHHQYQGGELGLEKLKRWSAEDCERYDEKVIESKWRSFKGKAKPVTMASVVYMAKTSGAFEDEFNTLLADASEVSSMSEFETFKQNVGLLSPEKMAQVVSTVYSAWGKEAGVGKRDIKKSIDSVNKSKNSDNGDWSKGWCFLEVPGVFYNKDLAYSISPQSFNMRFSGEAVCKAAETTASQWLTVHKKGGCSFYVDTMFWPGADVDFTYHGMKMLNSYRKLGCDVSSVTETVDENTPAVKRFLDHVANTLVDPVEQTILLDWLCHVVQKPGERVNWALLLQGAQGTGKTYYVELLQQALGTHVTGLDPDSIAGRFTGWAEGSLVLAVEEMRIAGSNRFQILDKIKPFLTNETITVEKKGQDHKTVPNFTSYLLLTNHKDAVPIVKGDRRYCVLFSKWQSEAQLHSSLGGEEGARIYFDELFNDLYNNAELLVKYITERKISKNFSPKSRAPQTKSKSAMMAYSRHDDDQQFEDLLDTYNCPIINENIIDVTHMKHLVECDGVDFPSTKTLMHILLALGYEKSSDSRVKVEGKYHYVWVASGSEIDVKTLVREYHSGGEDNIVF